MDTLFARYFDGDLDDREARDFLEAVEADPALEKELRAYERVLTVSARLPGVQAPDGFAKRVMAAVSAGEGRERSGWLPGFFSVRLAPMATVAAAVVLAFVGGWWIAGHSNRPLDMPANDRVRSDAVSTEIVPAAAGQHSVGGNGYRYIRLAYVSDNPSIRQVQVAGSFNNWDPGTTPMRRQDGVWSTILVLPPGSYEYMFVVDGAQWLTDPLAVQTRDDGFGGANAVLEVEL
jgi:hypothetical protein